LERILDAYNLNYEIIMNCSPDVGVEYFTNDIDFIKAFERADGWWHEEITVINDYAKKRGATAIVELYDGYERAVAIILKEGEE
jgi:hypothetical protein